MRFVNSDFACHHKNLYSGSGDIDGDKCWCSWFMPLFFRGRSECFFFGITSRDFWWVVFLFNLVVAVVCSLLGAF
jgi:hypothetical protein